MHGHGLATLDHVELAERHPGLPKRRSRSQHPALIREGAIDPQEKRPPADRIAWRRFCPCHAHAPMLMCICALVQVGGRGYYFVKPGDPSWPSILEPSVISSLTGRSSYRVAPLRSHQPGPSVKTILERWGTCS